MDDEDTTVRVAVRIRPQISREIIDMCNICTSVTPGEPQVTLGNDKAFTYNYVFDTFSTQDEVYEKCVAPLVSSSLQGYNATVLAYGQTGSGKTYTMGSGFEVNLPQDEIGIIPRAIHDLFNSINSEIEKAYELGMQPPEFKITAQFMELYNEEVIDLFNPTNNREKAYKIHEYPHTGIQVTGITVKKVTSAEEALQSLRLGALSRTTASTQMNTQSSRSHAIFTLQIVQQRIADKESNDFETLTAKFHFVDLAGSERLKRTGATGDRAKEGISINCGLLALGNVISALGDKSKKATYIPYRDSKLTRLLQDSLGGNSRTVMIACVSPSDRDFMETLNTLKYANRARNIKNKVILNQDRSSQTINMLKHQISQLQMELLEFKQGKRIINEDGTETVNDMFYENNLLQMEISHLKTRIKALQDTIDSLTLRVSTLMAEKVTNNWTNQDKENDLVLMIQTYMKEIEELRTKLLEANTVCDQLRKQIAKAAHHQSSISESDDSFNETNGLIKRAREELEKEKELLNRSQRSLESHNKSDLKLEEDDDTDSEEKEGDIKDELLVLNEGINMKQKLIDELELSHRRMQTMKQQYEDKLQQLQLRIKNTQEERDKILHSLSNQTHSGEKAKNIKEEYTRKINEMQKDLKRLQLAQKEHVKLVKNQSHRDNQLQSYKNELLELKRAKVRLINKMKEVHRKHAEEEQKRVREIAKLKKESRKNASMIKSMETECKLKDQILKRKQEEVSVLRRNQKSYLGLRSKSTFSEKSAKRTWRSIEHAINNIALNRRGLVEQEVRMEHFLEKRKVLGEELALLEEKRKQAVRENQDLTQIDSYIEDIKENINYTQEVIVETQKNVIDIEENQDTSIDSDLQNIVSSLSDVDESKYIIQKLYLMTLSQSHAVAQRDARLKETETTLEELKQENHVKSQLLDHVLNYDFSIVSKELITSVSSNANESTSTNSTRSSSPVSFSTLQRSTTTINRKKVPAAEDLLYGPKDDTEPYSQNLPNFGDSVQLSAI